MTKRLCALTLLPRAGLAAAQEAPYPNRPVRLIVPLGAGSSPDMRARVLAERLSVQLGQRFVIENQAGAGTTLGTAAVAAARADGYTLLVTLSPSLQTGPLLYQGAHYDPIDSFTPIGSFSRAAPFLVVSATQTLRTVKDLVDRARATPGGLPVASSGPGGGMHLPAQMLRQASGVDFLYVPYQGEAAALQDLLGGRVTAAFFYGGVAVPQVRAGRLRALAYAGTQRSTSLPEVPTFAEAGFAGVEFHVVLMLLGPAGLAQDIVDRLSQALRAATEDPALQAQFELTGSQVAFGTPSLTAATIRSDAATARRLIARLRIGPQ